MFDYFFPISFLVFEIAVLFGVRLAVAAVDIFSTTDLSSTQEEYEEDDSCAVPA